MTKDKLNTAKELAESAINRLGDFYAYMEEFDDYLGGSSITDELNGILEKAQKKMKKVLDSRFEILLN